MGEAFLSGFEGDWVARFAPEWGPRPAGHGEVVDDPGAPGGKALEVRYPKGGIGGPSGYQFLCRFPALGLRPCSGARLSYRVRFDAGFDFVKGGKLPGLGGGANNTGGSPPNGRDGWSARLMWRPGGRVVHYLYHPGQAGVYGDDLEWTRGGEPVRFTPGRWARVESRVRLNTPGRSDGEVEGYFDGVRVLAAGGLRFRDVPDLALDVFYFSTFFGGAEPDWAPSKDEAARFADFRIDTD